MVNNLWGLGRQSLLVVRRAVAVATRMHFGRLRSNLARVVICIIIQTHAEVYCTLWIKSVTFEVFTVPHLFTSVLRATFGHLDRLN
jgi:hypothetical protein